MVVSEAVAAQIENVAALMGVFLESPEKFTAQPVYTVDGVDFYLQQTTEGYWIVGHVKPGDRTSVMRSQYCGKSTELKDAPGLVEHCLRAFSIENVQFFTASGSHPVSGPIIEQARR